MAQIHDIADRAKAAGKVAALGGPSASAAPETYADYDYLHIGELGDATDRLIALLDESIAPPPQQMRFTTKVRLPITDFPLPAYHRIRLDQYLLGTLQFFLGLPVSVRVLRHSNLYGRQPRIKSPYQLIGELDCIFSQKAYPASIYFVDDNFMGNCKAAREMLPCLIAWQKRNGYPVSFSCEGTRMTCMDATADLAEGEAPIVFTSGSAMTRGNDFFAASAAACELLGRRALFVTRFPNQLPRPLPALVHHIHHAPFSQLLPRAAALVHRGGIGTAAQALKAGVPQLVAPCCYDQFDNAAHLQRLGVSV